mmetsp:Transcript_13504/g.31978  ORF Transcript_13504/g.31978 Transcript_13504/m.31978 type:complete len:285 (+) Transcript_13504:2-856(+)
MPHPTSGRFTVHIKDLGTATWTGQLAQLARHRRARGLAVALGGPYGHLKPPLGSHRRVFLVAGGVGVTPWLHCLERVSCGRIDDNGVDLPPDAVVTLVWSIREANVLSPFRRNLYTILAGRRAHAVRIKVFVTGKGEKVDLDAPHPHWRDADDIDDGDGPDDGDSLDPVQLSDIESCASDGRSLLGVTQALDGGTSTETSSTYTDDTDLDLESFTKVDLQSCVSYGRPDYPTLLSSCHPDAPDDPSLTHRDVCVYACGPPPLVHSVEKLCWQRGFVFSPETFDF